MMWLSAKVSVWVIVSIGVMVSVEDMVSGMVAEIRRILNIAFKAEQKLLFGE